MASLIVGLGNPGQRYRKTRHNLGFRVVDHLAAERGRGFEPGRGSYLFCELKEGKRGGVFLVKPVTYMNASGQAVAEALNHLGVGMDNLMVLCDDVNLPLGKIRIREKGSEGGHKGLESIVYHLGSILFPRLRMGVGQPPEGMELEEFVLAEFDREEVEEVETMIQTACHAVKSVWSCGIQESMNLFNA
jgi:PTH1 family peptidyl-tRNA hydrolase